MKKYIENIEEPYESELEYCLNWLAQSRSNGLHDFQASTIIRFLLKKNAELESRLEEIENKLK